jgi:predicted RNase H-like HicB family nuclease
VDGRVKPGHDGRIGFEMLPYIALIHKDDDSDYGVSFPDFPGCVTAGSTLDDARVMAAEALTFHIDGMTEDGDPIPEPSDLATIMRDRGNQNAVAFLVEADTRSSKTVRVNITLPEDVLKEIDAFAEREGYTRSGLIVKAALGVPGLHRGKR